MLVLLFAQNMNYYYLHRIEGLPLQETICSCLGGTYSLIVQIKRVKPLRLGLCF